jgi:pimeloyl-ACP methyl ester carboxylesterase
MNPTFETWEEKRAKLVIYWHVLVRGAKWIGRSLLRNPFAIAKTDEPRPSALKVFVRMGVSWAIFIPSLIVVSAIALVVQGTHPAPPPAVLDPNSQGCYFETVSFISEDGTALSGWLIPAIDAHRVILEKDKVLKSRRPAIVLVHDLGQSPQQMLPLIKPLHDEGINVLVVALRGGGSSRATGATFGINESKDVQSAVTYLRRTPFVDPNRVAVAGVGTGANAVLLAAGRDASIKTVVIANAVKDCDQVIAARIAPRGSELAWMEPICRWTFELMYKVNSDDLDYQRASSVLKSRPSLVFDTGGPYVFGEARNVSRIRSFCRKTLGTQDRTGLGMAR